ncbi:hypothetical protein I312_104218 [Cryptococcus bacillisporus CA1280]|uniref:uncharacterized protein n=1 Tax=Cryptococcus bacillisporus CA1280 TaxID=1296109 RepID=UPI0033697842
MRVLLAATRAAGSDPRLPQRGAGSNDVNVSHIVPNGCLSASDIEKEGTLLQTQLVTHLYSSSEPAILHPLINTLPAIAKMRPTLAPLVVHSLASWTPSALVAAGRSAMEIRAVDKTVRIAISHLLRRRRPGSGAKRSLLIVDGARIQILKWSLKVEVVAQKLPHSEEDICRAR